MIPKYNGSKSEKSTSFAPIPAGGYVAKIMGARIENYSWGSVLIIAFDIYEGEYTGFFQQRFDKDTSTDKKWKGTFRITIPDESSEYFSSQKRSFNNLIYALEASNGNYTFDWNENGLKGLTLGVLFRNKEWEYKGKTGWTTECCSVTDADEIRQGDFKIPKDKPLDNSSGSTVNTNSGSGSGFSNVPLDDDLPF